MSTASFIRQHIEQLPAHKIFSTRELLHYGSRAAVDTTLYRLVLLGDIVRLTSGIFVRKNVVAITTGQVAHKKAAVFGKKLIITGEQAAGQCGLLPSPQNITSYATDGSSSKFCYRPDNTIITFTQIAPRKFRLKEKIGLAIRGLWAIGKAAARQPGAIDAVTRNMSLQERQEFYTYSRWMPSWMSDYIATLHQFRPPTPHRLGAKPALLADDAKSRH